MKRRLEAVILSQNKMLEKTGKSRGPAADSKLLEYSRRHLADSRHRLNQQKNTAVIAIDFDILLSRPRETAEQIQSFLDIKVDIKGMVRQADSSLNHFPPL